MLNRDSSTFTDRDDRRLFLLSSLATAAFLTLVLRLFYLQVVRGADMARRAEMNATQILPLLAPRGVIFARQGGGEESLLDNAPRFSLFYVQHPKAGVPLSSIESELVRRLPQFGNLLKKKLPEAQKSGKMTRLLVNIPSQTALALMERRLFLPGVNVLVEPQRRARFGQRACHLLGYVGEVSDKDIRREREQGLRPGQWIGKTGIELMYDGLLRGSDGGLQFEMDAAGRHVHVVRRIPSVPGADLHLTIDQTLQAAAEAGLAKSGTRRGAAVAVDPRSGAVLALASSPGYDPSENLSVYLGNPGLPFFNRAIQGIYPLGSVFKIVTAVSALQEKVWDTRRTFFCSGEYDLNGKKFGCWKKHGRLDFFGAVASSCNVYFFNLGLASGVDALEAHARAFGFGEKAGIDVPGESSGLVPGRAWKKKTQRQAWYDGDTLNVSIGQGALNGTPLQAAMLLAAVANGGTLWRPYMVDRVVSPDHKVLLKTTPQVRRHIELTERTWTILHRALEGVVTQGSGYALHRPDLVMGAKTGTAQNPHGEDHSWFSVYAGRRGEPAGLAVAVFVENGGRGSVAAGPVAKQMVDAYYGSPLP